MPFADEHEHDSAVSEIMWCVHALMGVLMPDEWVQGQWVKPPSPFGADHGRKNWTFVKRCKMLQVATDAMFDTAIQYDTDLRKDVKLVCGLLSLISIRMTTLKKGEDNSYKAFISLFDRVSFAALLFWNTVHTPELKLILKAISDGMLSNRSNLGMAVSDDMLDGSIVRILSTIGENLMKIETKNVQSHAVRKCLSRVSGALCPSSRSDSTEKNVNPKVKSNDSDANPPRSNIQEPSNYDTVEPYGNTKHRTVHQISYPPPSTGSDVEKTENDVLRVSDTTSEYRLQDMSECINEAKDIVLTNGSYAGSVANFEFSLLCEILLKFSAGLCSVSFRDRKAGAKLMQVLMKIKFTADAVSERKIGPFHTVFNAISRSMQGMGKSLEAAKSPEDLNHNILDVLETLAANLLLVCESPMKALNQECEEFMFEAIYCLNPLAD